MKLELKHLSTYLPYELKVQDIDDNTINTLFGIKLKNKDLWFFYSNGTKDRARSKPILRPLSDLKSEIEFNGRKFNPIEELAEIDEVVCLQYSFEFFKTSMKYLPHWIVEQLLEWHFDIFGLIENGLAVDINTLES